MPQVSKAYTFQNGVVSDATQVNQDFDTLFNLVNGQLDSTNLASSGIKTANIANEAVTPALTEGIPYAADMFGSGFIFSGLTCTKDGTNANQVNFTAGLVYIKQTDGSLRRLNIAAGNVRTTSPSSTYYLDINPDGTYTWGGHSTQANYINVATVTSDASSNVNVITQNTAAYNVTIMSGATGPVQISGSNKTLIEADVFNDFVINGTAPSTSANLTTTTPVQTAYVMGQRVTSTSDTHTYTASQDTYIDLSSSGTLTYTGVANNATAPSVAANSIRLFKVVTSATAVTTVTDLRALTPVANKGISASSTGATAASRYVGATASGAPTTGTFAVGDFVIDRTGLVWVCITAGTPGTWKKVGTSPAETIIDLWVYDPSYVSVSATAAGQSFVQKGSTTFYPAASNSAILHTLNSSWPASTNFALEVGLGLNTGTAANAALWDATTNTEVTASAVSYAASSTIQITRSGTFTLVPGHSYAVTVWVSGTTSYISSAKLVALGS